jgi:hypothetical protein
MDKRIAGGATRSSPGPAVCDVHVGATCDARRCFSAAVAVGATKLARGATDKRFNERNDGCTGEHAASHVVGAVNNGPPVTSTNDMAVVVEPTDDRRPPFGCTDERRFAVALPMAMVWDATSAVGGGIVATWAATALK